MSSGEERGAIRSSRGVIMGSVRVIELQLVAFIMVFSASGLVPVIDLAFPVFTTGYLVILSRLAFPSSRRRRGTSTTTTTEEEDEIIMNSSSSSRRRGSSSSSAKYYYYYHVILGTTIGLFLPLAYVLGGFARGDEDSVESATPHLFLLSCQILTENIITSSSLLQSLFSPPVKALVPILYTVRRIFVILDWVQHIWLQTNSYATHPQIKDVAWFWFGRVLALSNLAYFSINLFGFLIPRLLPKAFDQYLREENEIQKKVEDKQQQQQQLHDDIISPPTQQLKKSN